MAASSQVTINSNHIISTGLKFNQYSDTSQNLNLALQTGGPVAKIWDFSALQKHDTTIITCFNPDWKPAFTPLLAPNCNLILKTGSDDTYIMANKSSTGFNALGLISDTSTDVAIKKYASFIYNFSIMRYPITNNTVISDSSSSSTREYLGFDPDGPGPAPSIDSIEIISKEKRVYKGIGFGTVKFSNTNNINNCLMINIDEISLSTYRAFIRGNWITVSSAQAAQLGLSPSSDTSRSHQWWTSNSGYGFPIVEYYYEGTDVDDPIFIDAKAVATLVNNPFSNLKVYPNPTNGVINFEGLANNAVFSITNAIGQTIKTGNLDNNMLNVADLVSGSYIVNVSENGVTYQTKITVQ